MKRMMQTICCVCLSVIAIVHTGGAQDLKHLVILNIHQLREPMKERALKVLEQAGFVDGENITITFLQPASSEQGAAQVRHLNPDVVIDMSLTRRVVAPLYGSTIPLITPYEVEPYVDDEGTPQGNITGIYSSLPDVVYHSYQFLQEVAPIEPGQSAVFLNNTRNPRGITPDIVADALHRLDIPLKTTIDTAILEEWQDAVLTYNDDPEVGWILMNLPGMVKRDGSLTNMKAEAFSWLGTHLKKPTVTYWEPAVHWGVLCGFGIDVIELAAQAAEMAVQVLKGTPVHDIHAVLPRKTFVAVNCKTANLMGMTFSLDVLKAVNVIAHDHDGQEIIRK